MGPPKYKSNLKGISVREVNGVEVIITPEGRELIGRTGEGILGCVAYNGDEPSEIPRRFKKRLISNSEKGRLYVPYFSDDVAFKFYKRKEFEESGRILIETGIDQLEAAYFINKNTKYHSPAPYFASIDVLCMEYIRDMMPFPEFIKLHPEKEKEAGTIICKIEGRLNKNIVTSSANFHIDYDLFKKTGKIKINPFDQKWLMDSNDQRWERIRYLDKKHNLGIFD